MAPECPCGRLDVHAHFLPPVYMEALAQHGITEFDGSNRILSWSVDAALKMMDNRAIDTAIVSLSSPSVHVFPLSERPKICRSVNLAGHALTVERSDRFGYFASLPLPDVAASLREIAYAFDELQADGIVLETNIEGLYLGHAKLAPVFAELNRRKAVVFLHPTSPVCSDVLALGRPSGVVEFPFDTTRAVVDMLFSRTIQSNPDIRFILPHAGGTVPFLAQRIASFAGRVSPGPESPAEVYETLARVYYDLALATSPAQIAALRLLAPITQMLLGSDWPFASEQRVGEAFRQLAEDNGFSSDELDDIQWWNGVKLFPRLARR